MEKNTSSVTQQARFEFRSFGQDFKKAHHKMARLSVPVKEELWERISEEVYIISDTTENYNLKIRNNRIEIKALINKEQGFEQWSPEGEYEFPVSSSVLREVFLKLNVKAPIIEQPTFTAEAFIDIFKTHPYVTPVRVKKKRYAYLVNDTICEFSKVLINGARVYSISAESINIKDVQKTLELTELTGTENINYTQAIKRITGTIHLPLANE